ncbi:AEC family transporter [Microbulbifer agarilyticus]|uniref:AEC family transporter n=1 Tax=Microbulbifer agarilyticus TaxID=260552 RepID=UPI001C93F73C|nr:AEC family transporter [Microbulbifer agarilyticus]MBY6189455.1 AEC family transporter [Microbulbifer agarilyticus]MBY6210727.1 AEC family transporter [Microbulbifer agarilyticus]
MDAVADTFSFALSVTAPIFLTLLVGYGLARAKLLSNSFVDDASRLVFLITLPALLFFNIFGSDAAPTDEWPLLLAGLLGTVLTVPLAWLCARPLAYGDRSAFIQGAFRGNLGIIGLAWAVNAYGPSGLAQAALLMAVITIFYNIAAVALFAVYSQKAKFSWRKLAIDVARNPLIVAIVSALVAKAVGLKLPQMVVQTGEYLASVTLPLALLCIGASLDLSMLRRSSFGAVVASAFKLLVVPVVLVAIGWMFQLDGQSMAILFLLAAAPTASASFIMARALGGNSQLAANIVAISTLFSIVTASLGLALLKVNLP